MLENYKVQGVSKDALDNSDSNWENIPEESIEKKMQQNNHCRVL